MPSSQISPQMSTTLCISLRTLRSTVLGAMKADERA